MGPIEKYTEQRSLNSNTWAFLVGVTSAQRFCAAIFRCARKTYRDQHFLLLPQYWLSCILGYADQGFQYHCEAR